MSYDLLVLTGPIEHQTSPVMNYSKADNDTADVSMKAASLRYHKHTKLLCCFLSTEHDTYSDKDKPRHLSQHMDNNNASSAMKENIHGRSQLMAEKSKTASKFDTAKSCHLGAFCDKSDMTNTVYGEWSNHGNGRGFAEVTSHDFQLRNGEKDRRVSVEGELRRTKPTRLHQRTGWSKDKRT